MTFSKWVTETFFSATIRKKYSIGSRSRAAFEAGANYHFRGSEYESIYVRADSIRAFDAGWNEARKMIVRNEIVTCDCCGQPFPTFR
jgi:hypothetical protein